MSLVTPLRSIDSNRWFSTTGFTPGGGGDSSLTSMVLPSQSVNLRVPSPSRCVLARRHSFRLHRPGTRSTRPSRLRGHRRCGRARWCALPRSCRGPEENGALVDDLVGDVGHAADAQVGRGKPIRCWRVAARDICRESPQHQPDQAEDREPAQVGEQRTRQRRSKLDRLVVHLRHHLSLPPPARFASAGKRTGPGSRPPARCQRCLGSVGGTRHVRHKVLNL